MAQPKPAPGDPVQDVLPVLPSPAPPKRRSRRWVLVLVLSILVLAGCFVLLGVLGFLSLVWLSAASPESPWYRPNDPDIRQSLTTFDSGGQSILVERFEPRQEGKYPAILVVHGADGLQFEVWTHVYQGMAQELARHGYVALLVHYFDRTGSKFGDDRTNRANFLVWMQTLEDAVTFAQKQSDVDADHLGLLGVSLGSYLSLSVAATDPRLGAVVEYFGGLPSPVADNLKRMPPVLILHGDADRLVNVREAHHLEKLLQEKDLPFEIKIYPGQGHGFKGDAARDAMKRTLEFFDKHLKEGR